MKRAMVLVILVNVVMILFLLWMLTQVPELRLESIPVPTVPVISG